MTPIDTSTLTPSYAAQVDDLLEQQWYEATLTNLVSFNDRIVDQNRQIAVLQKRLWINPIDSNADLITYHDIQAFVDTNTSIDLIKHYISQNKASVDLAMQINASKREKILTLSNLLRDAHIPLPVLPSRQQRILDDWMELYQSDLDERMTTLGDDMQIVDTSDTESALDESNDIFALLDEIWYDELIELMSSAKQNNELYNISIRELQKKLHISPLMEPTQDNILYDFLGRDELSQLTLQQVQDEIYTVGNLKNQILHTLEQKRIMIEELESALLETQTISTQIQETLTRWNYNQLVQDIDAANTSIYSLNEQIMQLEQELWIQQNKRLDDKNDGIIDVVLTQISELQDLDAAMMELERLWSAHGLLSDIAQNKLAKLQDLQEVLRVKNAVDDQQQDDVEPTPEHQTIERPIFAPWALPFAKNAKVKGITWLFGDPRVGHSHGWIDIWMNEQEIQSVADWVVIDTWYQWYNAKKKKPGAWYYITILHKGWYVSRYLHLKAMPQSQRLKKWDKVSAWQKIATSGKTWWVGPHLHFELRVWWSISSKGTPVDPTKYFDFSKYDVYKKSKKQKKLDKPTLSPTYIDKEEVIWIKDMKEVTFSDNNSIISENRKLMKKWNSYKLVIWESNKKAIFDEKARTFALPFDLVDIQQGKTFTIFGTEWKITMEQTLDGQDMPHIEMVDAQQKMEGIASYSDALSDGTVASPFLPQGTRVRITNSATEVSVDAVVDGKWSYCTTRTPDQTKHGIDITKNPYRMLDVSSSVAQTLWMTYQGKPDGIAKVAVQILE